MNWKRIWTGMALAAFAIGLIDGIQMYKHMFMSLARWSTVQIVLVQILVPSLVDGFFCAWLYAVMRPRLGPGPKTAVITGTVLFFIKTSGLSLLVPTVMNIFWSFVFWLKFVAGSYLAGWQYIEKAP